jgi:hypothetical protein
MMGHLGMVINQGMRGMGQAYNPNIGPGERAWVGGPPSGPTQQQINDEAERMRQVQKDADDGKAKPKGRTIFMAVPRGGVPPSQQGNPTNGWVGGGGGGGVSPSSSSTIRIAGPCDPTKARAMLPHNIISVSSNEQTFEFDDCYLIYAGGAMRQVSKASAGGGGGRGGGGGGGVVAPVTPVDTGPDWWAQYDAYLKSLHRQARTTTKAAKWVGDPTAKPATAEDYLAIVQAQSKTVASSVMNPAIAYAQYPMYDPNAAPVTGGNILNAGSFAQSNGPVLEFF